MLLEQGGQQQLWWIIAIVLISAANYSPLPLTRLLLSSAPAQTILVSNKLADWLCSWVPILLHLKLVAKIPFALDGNRSSLNSPAVPAVKFICLPTLQELHTTVVLQIMPPDTRLVHQNKPQVGFSPSVRVPIASYQELAMPVCSEPTQQGNSRLQVLWGKYVYLLKWIN